VSSLSDYIDELENDPEIISLVKSEDQAGKITEIRKLIEQVSEGYGGDDACFLAEYINDQLSAFPLDDLINCFRSLHADIQNLKCLSASIIKSTRK
jgi:hypothetical protein